MAARPAFVDAHVHLWELGRIRYPWLKPPFAAAGPNGSVEAIARDYRMADYRADAAGWNVRGLVHVDAGAEPSAALAETRWLQAMADAGDGPAGIVAFAALDDPGLDPLLGRHAEHRLVRGIRHIVNWHPDPRRSYTARDLTRDEAWARGFALLARHGLSFDLQCYPAQMPALARLLARNDSVPVVIDHLGMPVLADPDGVAEWRAGLAALARLPQAAIKLSGLGFIRRDWTPEFVRPFVLEAIDLFGAGRCMVASDAPTDLLFAPFDRTMSAFADAIAAFSGDERRDLLGRNADRIYRLGLDI